jgi:hypothetical protein
MTEGIKLDGHRQLQAKWYRMMKEAVDADEWGQTLEAAEAYERLAGFRIRKENTDFCSVLALLNASGSKRQTSTDQVGTFPGCHS